MVAVSHSLLQIYVVDFMLSLKDFHLSLQLQNVLGV